MNDSSDAESPQDEYLGNLLRNVTVPQDLHQRLRSIPEKAQAESNDTTARDPVELAPRQRSVSTGTRNWMRGVVAVALAAVALVIAWQLTRTLEDQNVANTKILDRPSPPQPATPSLMEQVEQRQQLIQAKLFQARVQQMDQRIAMLDVPTRAQFDEADETSLILALAGEASIEMGSSSKNVNKTLNHLLRRYPGTSGANVAEDLLNQQNH